MLLLKGLTGFLKYIMELRILLRLGQLTRLSDYIKYWDRVLSSRSVEKPATASLEPRQVPGLKNVYLFISYKVSNKNLSTRISFLVFSAFLVAIGRNGRWAYKKNGAGAQRDVGNFKYVEKQIPERHLGGRHQEGSYYYTCKLIMGRLETMVSRRPINHLRSSSCRLSIFLFSKNS